ncbi:amidohydrolase [Ruminococcus sp. AF18-22]|nr:amidohydrolase [Ruminococcus sp. AF18-22]
MEVIAVTSVSNVRKKTEDPTYIRKRAEELEEETIILRRWLHQHAEVSWKEYECTEYIVRYLEELGLDVHRYEGHTGCWTMIHGGKAQENSKTILLRADFDALPIQEETELSFASVHPGVFHGCGHETHAAMLLAACKMLVEIQEELPGNVKILFQAGEETANGAEYYVEQGILDGVDAVYGCHTASWLEKPYIAVNPGPRCASTDEFSIQVQGEGCHGGMPHQGKDALVAACSIVMNLQTMVSRGTDPVDALVVTVGKLESGTNYNVVADTACMSGTVRTYSKEVRDAVEEKMCQIAENTAQALGCTASVNYIKKTGAVVHDDPDMCRIAHDAVVKLFGQEALMETRPMGGGDDFAYFSERVPGIYAFIGAAMPSLDGKVHAHHHPKVCFNEESLKRGVAMHVQMAIDFLNE